MVTCSYGKPNLDNSCGYLQYKESGKRGNRGTGNGDPGNTANMAWSKQMVRMVGQTGSTRNWGRGNGEWRKQRVRVGESLSGLVE